jgi:hypothetical protein
MRRCILLGLLVACGDADPAPSVTVVAAMPEALDPSDDGADDLTVTVEYADGDADLGGGIASIHDCRAEEVVVTLELPPIASQEAIDEGVPITGTLDLIVADIGEVDPASAAPPVCAELGVGPPSAGSAIFCVVLTDLAGNSGSGDCTGSIEITAP